MFIQLFPYEQDVTQGWFLSEPLPVWIQSFFLLDWLPYQGKRTQSALLFIHSQKENRWIHAFLN